MTTVKNEVLGPSPRVLRSPPITTLRCTTEVLRCWGPPPGSSGPHPFTFRSLQSSWPPPGQGRGLEPPKGAVGVLPYIIFARWHADEGGPDLWPTAAGTYLLNLR